MLVFLLLVPIGATAKETTTVALKKEVTVKGNSIVLGRVADFDGEIPDKLPALSLGNAPWPGRAREISRVLVKARMLSAGFEMGRFRFGGEDTCLVKMKALRVQPDRIVEAAKENVRSRFPGPEPEVDVQLRGRVRPVLVAPGSPPELRAAPSGRAGPAGDVRVNVDVLRGGKLLERVPVRLEVRLHRRVAVARTRIAAGEALNSENVSFVRRDVTRVHGTPFGNRKELEGKVARRVIDPGETVTDKAAGPAEAPVVIQANQRVFLVVRTSTMRVVTKGKATRSARLGEAAVARNLRTAREVSGVALKGGVIRVLMGSEEDEG